MEIISIFGDNRFESFSKLREACRAIVLSNDRILLSYEVNTDQYFLPGGGLEQDERLAECCAREVAEETGYWVFPQFRGNGTGHRCFEALERYTKLDGAVYYELNSTKENAMRFWKSLGFVENGVDEYDMPLMVRKEYSDDSIG